MFTLFEILLKIKAKRPRLQRETEQTLSGDKENTKKIGNTTYITLLEFKDRILNLIKE